MQYENIGYHWKIILFYLGAGPCWSLWPLLLFITWCSPTLTITVWILQYLFWDTFLSRTPPGMNDVPLQLLPCASLLYYVIWMKRVRESSQSRIMEGAEEWPDRQINLVRTILYNDIFEQFLVFILFCLNFSLQRGLSKKCKWI